MYFITLALTEKKDQAPQHMAAHNEWIAKGFDEGAFLLTGSLKPQGGGAILAVAQDLALLSERIAADPFVREGIVTANIQQIAPGRTDARLMFLKDVSP